MTQEEMALEFCRSLPEVVLSRFHRSGMGALHLIQMRDRAFMNLALHGIQIYDKAGHVSDGKEKE